MGKLVKGVFKAISSVVGAILSIFVKIPKTPKQDNGTLDSTQVIQRRLQNNAPREVLTGRRIVGGVGSFDNSRGINRETGERISIFSSVECTAFHDLYMDGEAVTLSGDPTAGWVNITSHFLGKNNVPRASFRLWLGGDNSGLGAELKALYPTLWNSYNDLTELNDIDDHNGLCLGMLRGVNTNDDLGDEDDPEDQQGKNFIPFRGFPEFRVELSGAKICDPRNGGVYSNPSTYAYSANSGLVDGQFQHGWFGGENGDKLIAGLGYAGDYEDLLDVDQIEDNADYCDTHEFECHGVITSGSASDGKNIRDTFNGILVESLAKIRTIPEGNRPHYGTIDFANYPAARVKTFDEDGYSTEVYNATQTKYIEPLEKYSEKDLPDLTKPEWIEDDGGETNPLKQTLPFVTDATQAAKIEKADLFTSRLQANGEIENLPLIPFEDYAVGGTVTLANTDVPAMNGRTWSIEGYAETPEGYINFALREYSALAHDFDEDDVPDTKPNVAPPRDPDFPPRPFANPGTLSTVRLAGEAVIIQESWVEDAILTSAKTGSTASITISAHTRHYTDKSTGVSVSLSTLTGLTLNTFYYVYYDDADRAGGGVTFHATTDRPTARTSTTNPARHYVGYITTPAETGPTSTTGTTATPPTQVPERVPNADNADMANNTANVGGTSAQDLLDSVSGAISSIDDIEDIIGDPAQLAINSAALEQAKEDAEAAAESAESDAGTATTKAGIAVDAANDSVSAAEVSTLSADSSIKGSRSWEIDEAGISLGLPDWTRGRNYTDDDVVDPPDGAADGDEWEVSGLGYFYSRKRITETNEDIYVRWSFDGRQYNEDGNHLLTVVGSLPNGSDTTPAFVPKTVVEGDNPSFTLTPAENRTQKGGVFKVNLSDVTGAAFGRFHIRLNQASNVGAETRFWSASFKDVTSEFITKGYLTETEGLAEIVDIKAVQVTEDAATVALDKAATATFKSDTQTLKNQTSDLKDDTDDNLTATNADALATGLDVIAAENARDAAEGFKDDTSDLKDDVSDLKDDVEAIKVTTAADAALTAADVILTNADAAATQQDRSATSKFRYEAQSAATRNLVRTGTGTNGVGGWLGEATDSRVPPDAPSGAKSLKLGDAEESDFYEGNPNGRIIRITGWVNTQNVTLGAAEFAVRGEKANGSKFANKPFPALTTGADWFFYDETAEITETDGVLWGPGFDVSNSSDYVLVYDLRYEDVTESYVSESNAAITETDRTQTGLDAAAASSAKDIAVSAKNTALQAGRSLKMTTAEIKAGLPSWGGNRNGGDDDLPAPNGTVVGDAFEMVGRNNYYSRTRIAIPTDGIMYFRWTAVLEQTVDGDVDAVHLIGAIPRTDTGGNTTPTFAAQSDIEGSRGITLTVSDGKQTFQGILKVDMTTVSGADYARGWFISNSNNPANGPEVLMHYLEIEDISAAYKAQKVLSASVSENAGAIVTLEGKNLAWIKKTTATSEGGKTLLALVSDGETGTALLAGQSIVLSVFDESGDITDSTTAMTFEGGLVQIQNAELNATTITAGDLRIPVALQPVFKSGADGDIITFGGNVAIQPDIRFDLTQLPSLASGSRYEAKAIARTASQFEVSLKSIASATLTTVTDTVDASGGTDRREMDKTNSADAGTYNFRVKGTIVVTSTAFGGNYSNMGMLSIQTEFNNGGGFDDGPVFTVTSQSVGVPQITSTDQSGTYNFDVTFPVDWGNTIGLHGGKEFAVSKKSGHGTITDLYSVAYDVLTGGTTTAVTESVPISIQHYQDV